MDISKEYIEMCSKATEIQEQWKKNFADHYFSAGETFQIQTNHLYKFGEVIGSWLPRQDQLQEMMEAQNYTAPVNYLMTCIHRFYCDQENDFESMEQLWLTFIMKENFNKSWNFETKEWIIK